jgi:LmbE family N-acetylglucosaminyl deacetylase
VRLTDPDVARALLPDIRGRELAAALRVLGAREHAVLGEPDTGFSLDPRPFVEEGAWDRERVVDAIGLRLSRGYDLLLVMLPAPETHAHHKASTLLALDAVMRADVLLRAYDAELYWSFACNTDAHEARARALLEPICGWPLPRG